MSAGASAPSPTEGSRPEELRTYRWVIAYDGSDFAGWQRQPNARTVQGEVEAAVGALVGREARVVGAGRTDAGVHARGQVAHWRSAGSVDLQALVFGVNHHLPGEIRVLAAARMPDSFHALRSAEGKEYRYRLRPGRIVPPHRRRFVARLHPAVDVQRLERALAAFVGRHDFAAFAKTGSDHRSSVRTVRQATLVRVGDELECRFEGDGFLRGMVRLMVGTAVDEARGRFEAGATARALEQGAASQEVGAAAPASGLTLHRVHYPTALSPLESFEP